MKARLPHEVIRKEADWREWMTWLQILLTCWTLHEHFGFGKDRLLRFLQFNGDDSKEIADMKYGYAANKTWQDELWHWGETMGLNDVIKGVSPENRKD